MDIGDWFYTTGYAVFGHGVKATERSPPDTLPNGSLHNPKVSQRIVLKR